MRSPYIFIFGAFCFSFLQFDSGVPIRRWIILFYISLHGCANNLQWDLKGKVEKAATMNAAFAPVIASKIPLAIVLGIHDQESTLLREG